jgi:hypothetical protein
MAGVGSGPIWTHGQWQRQGKEHNSPGVIVLSPEDTPLLSRTMFLQDFVYVKVSSNKSSKYAKFWRVCSDGLDGSNDSRRADLLPMRTEGMDRPTTGVRLLHK